MLLQAYLSTCTKCGKKCRGCSNCPQSPGFSQPAHHPASGVEPGGGPKLSASRSTGHKTNNRSSHKTNGNNVESNEYNPINLVSYEKDKQLNTNTENEYRVHNKTNSIVFNYSSQVLTDSMEKVLNRGLNFCLLPYKLDITQTLVEYKRFERSAVWSEFHHGKEPDTNIEDPIFKTIKTNLPKNYSIPDALKVFLSSVKSDFMDMQHTSGRN